MHLCLLGVAPSIYNDWMNTFYANVSAYGTLKPYMLSPGNHEAPCNYGEYEARAAAMPHWGSNSADVQYYSYDVGRVHVVALSGESGRLSSPDGPEVSWLRADLAKAKAAKASGKLDWIVTHVHYPNVPVGYCSSMMTYCCANGKVGGRRELEGRERFSSLEPKSGADPKADTCVSTFMTSTNKAMEDLWLASSVDVHVTAHQHVYERTTPVYRYKAYGNGTAPFPADGNAGSLFVDPVYPINVNNGCPGNVELQDVWMPRPSWSIGLRTNADGSGNTTANGYADFGVLRFIATPAAGSRPKTLQVDYIGSRTETVLDSFTIRRS